MHSIIKKKKNKLKPTERFVLAADNYFSRLTV